MKRWKKIAAGVVVALSLAIWLAAGIIPGILAREASRWVKENTGREFSLGYLSVNPLTLAVEAGDLRLTEAQSSRPFASLAQVRINFSLQSLFRHALIIRSVQIDKPVLSIVRTAPGVFNFSDLSGATAGKKAIESDDSPFLFSVNNLQITDGELVYIDRSMAEEKRHTVSRLNVRVPFFGNTPYLAEQYVSPSVSAVIDNSPIAVEGRLKPFADAVEVSLEIDLQDLNLPVYMAHLPAEFPVRIRQGRLAMKSEVVYRASKTEKPSLQLSGQIALTGLSVLDRVGDQVFFLPLAQIDILPSRVLERQLHLGEVAIYNLEVFVNRDQRGVWNHSRFAGQGEESEAAAPFLLTMTKARIRDGEVHFADALPPGGFTAEAREVNLDLGTFSTEVGTPTPFSLSFKTEREERGEIGGEVSSSPLELNCSVAVTGGDLAAYYPYLAGLLTAPIGGKAAVRAELAVRGVDSLRIDKGSLEITELYLPFAGNEGLRLGRFGLSGMTFDAGTNRLAIDAVTLAEGDVRFSRGRNGQWSPLRLLRPQTPTGPGRKKATPEALPLTYRINRIAGTNWKIAFRDEVPEAKPSFELSGIRFSATDLAGPAPTTSTFRLDAAYGRRGSIEVSGTAVPTIPRFKIKTRLQQVRLPDFAPYLPARFRIILADGHLDATLAVTARRSRQGWVGDYRGKVGIRNLYCLDEEHRGDLLKWANLQIDGIRGSIAPFSLGVRAVALSDYAAKVVIHENGRLNLQDIFAGKPAEVGQPPTAQTPKADASKDILIETVTLQGGTLDFTDNHLKPKFSTTMVNLGGRISGLASAHDRLADVDLRGNLENQSPLRITGKINPFAENLFVDLDINFSDIELTPLTPYSGTYLGYTVDKGKLFLDLSYRIDRQMLDSENKVFLDQFTLGDRVESDKATNLPVKLAIALLKNRQGEIRLDLPVTGRTDDPQFSIWSVAFKMLKNLLVKAATSPLSLLAAAFGGGEDFSTVSFPYGTFNLPPPEQEKLHNLAAALRERPGLRLEIKGFVDPERDPEGYRREQLQVQMRKEKFLDLVKRKENPPGKTAAAVEIDPDEYSLYLTKVYRRADFPKPRNFFGFLKTLPDAEMEKLILTNTVVGPDEMMELAEARARAVQRFLVEEGGLERERLFIVRADITQAPQQEGSGGNRVEFSVNTR